MNNNNYEAFLVKCLMKPNFQQTISLIPGNLHGDVVQINIWENMTTIAFFNKESQENFLETHDKKIFKFHKWETKEEMEKRKIEQKNKREQYLKRKKENEEKKTKPKEIYFKYISSIFSPSTSPIQIHKSISDNVPNFVFGYMQTVNFASARSGRFIFFTSKEITQKIDAKFKVFPFEKQKKQFSTSTLSSTSTASTIPISNTQIDEHLSENTKDIENEEKEKNFEEKNIEEKNKLPNLDEDGIDLLNGKQKKINEKNKQTEKEKKTMQTQKETEKEKKKKNRSRKGKKNNRNKK